jgi:hypothetical protein
MSPKDLLEGLLELAHEADLEVRILSAQAASAENAPTQSAAARVGARIWVVLAPNDPPEHQARILAGALARHRGAFLEDRFVTPGLRDFIDRVDPLDR